nr:hypothetical protein [Actinomycetes bacterium]
IRPGNVVTISAHSGVGKTAFVLCAILNLIDKLKPWFVSLEMPADELITRALCQLARIDIQDAMEGHLSDARVAEALMGLKRVCADVRFVGSYPRHNQGPTPAPTGTTDADYAAAADWLRSLEN